MSRDTPEDEDRRKFVKGAVATGVAATGLGAFGGSASAQQNIQNLPVNVSEQSGLINVNLQNISALNNINVEDIVVTVIGGDLTVEDVQVVNIGDIDADVDVNVSNVLNNNVVQVAVAALSDTGDIVAAGSDALNL